MRVKRKLFLTTAFAALLSVGVFAGVASQKEASKVEAAGSGWFMTGSGSFMHGTDWAKADGVELDAVANNKGALLNFYLEAGDVFKITDGSFWAGWDRNAGIDTNYLEHTSYLDKNKTKATLYFDHTACSWWANDSSVTVVNQWGGTAGHGLSNVRLSGSSGQIDIYTDNPTIKFERSAYSGNNTGNQTIPSDFSAKNTFKLNSAGNGGSWDYYCDSAKGSNIRVKTSGYYDIYFNNDSNIYIAPVTVLFPGDSVYLNLNGQWSGQTPKVHFWNSGNTGVAQDVTMTEVHGSGLSTKLYECKVPSLSSGNPDRVIFYYGNYTKKTSDLNVLNSSNRFKLTSDSGGTWDGFIFNETRAEYYGTYFLTQVTCNSGSLDPTSNWSNASTEYSHICDNAQTIIHDSAGSPSGSDLVKAMDRYDYIVFFKQYSGYNDFIGRSDSPGKSHSGYGNVALIEFSKDIGGTIAIIAISSVSLAAVAGYFFFRKKKEN